MARQNDQKRGDKPDEAIKELYEKEAGLLRELNQIQASLTENLDSQNEQSNVATARGQFTRTKIVSSSDPVFTQEFRPKSQIGSLPEVQGARVFILASPVAKRLVRVTFSADGFTRDNDGVGGERIMYVSATVTNQFSNLPGTESGLLPAEEYSFSHTAGEDVTPLFPAAQRHTAVWWAQLGGPGLSGWSNVIQIHFRTGNEGHMSFLQNWVLSVDY